MTPLASICWDQFSLRTVFGDRTQTALGWLSHIQGSHQLHRELSNEPWENGRTPLQLLLVAWATHKLISWPLESLCLLPPPKLQGVHIRLLLSLLDASLSSTKRGNVEMLFNLPPCGHVSWSLSSYQRNLPLISRFSTPFVLGYSSHLTTLRDFIQGNVSDISLWCLIGIALRVQNFPILFPGILVSAIWALEDP